jgi:hypothetical protein
MESMNSKTNVNKTTRLSKTFLLIFVTTFFSHKSFATAFEDPATFCDGGEACTTRMKRIAAEYETGTLQVVQKELSAYSGECFLLNPDYDSKHAHHGAFVFKSDGVQTLGNGIFSFFSPSDPYAHLDSVALSNYIGQSGSYAPIQLVANSHLEMAFVTADSDIRYWFRIKPETRKLIVIGRNFGIHYSTLVFCEMNFHSN